MSTTAVPIASVRMPFLKRVFDVAASSVVIAALFPVMAVIVFVGAIERLLSPSARGPILYKETRISKGRPFNFYKMRTFKLSALEKVRGNGVIHTKPLEQDFRNLTLVGMVLVQTYLDEFPQLFHVLFGQMTFVGPRPTNTEVYERDIASGRYARAILKAGLTGRFQTHKAAKYGLDQNKVDMEYAEFVRTHSGLRVIHYDTIILIQTVYTIFRAEGI